MPAAGGRTLIGGLVLVGLGIAAGALNNVLAGSDRHMEWVAPLPPKGKPRCPETLPAPGEPAAAGATSESTAPATAPAGGATPAPAEGAAPAPPPISIPPVPSGQPYVELDPARVRALHDQGALFIDARRTSQYEEGHVAGALSIPIWEADVDGKIQRVGFEVQGDTGRPIVVYCGGGDCEDSHMLGDKLWQAGYTSVYVYKDGFPDWSEHGGTVVTGSERK